MKNTKRDFAFTLAEVLITLGIIGVVAAMTLPTLLNKNEERVTVTKVKKFYSVMNQALLFAIKDNGYVNEWSFNQEDEDGNRVSDKFVQYIKPYLKISKDCGGNSGCITSDVYKHLDGTSWLRYNTSKWYYKMILADGSYLWIRTTYNGSNMECDASDAGTYGVCGLMWTDINGKLPPNTFGKDVFVFFILSNRIIPYPINDCYAGGRGWGCSAYILSHGDMKYLYK